MTVQHAAVPVVAQHPEEDDTFNGAGIFESAAGIVDGIQEGDWFSAGGNTLAFGLAAIGAIMDPLQAVFSAGVGWVIEHVDFLKKPLDWLAGDPGAIQNNAKTWGNIRLRLDEAAKAYEEALATNATLWQSRAATAYRAEARVRIEALQALGVMGSGGQKACTIVGAAIGVARATIRDIIADVVGAIISKALQALTVVLAPKVLFEIGLLVGEVSTRILTLLDRLIKMVRRVSGQVELGSGLLRQIQEALESAADLKASRIAGAMLGDSASTGFGLAYAWRAVGAGQQLVYGSTGKFVGGSLAGALKENFLQEAGKAADSLRKESARAENALREQQLREQQAASLHQG